jgi:pimeloyl-ACP methyl ester carboxylesterase
VRDPEANPTRPAGEQPAERRVRSNGVDLCVFEWAGEGPPVLLAHATGFHARTWDAVARRLPGRRLVAVDMRGHGRSERPEERYRWDRFGEDVADLVRVLDLRDVVAVGHSMGGHSVTYAAAMEPERFAALLLLDPVISRRPPAVAQPREDGSSGTSFVARRRNEWSSAEEMVERFRGRSPHSLWRPEVLEDYARYGLLAAPEGEGYVLACPPAVEAEIYSASHEFDIYPLLPRVQAPVRILRARPPAPGEQAFTASPTDPALASEFADAEDVLLGDLTHFIPMQAPELVAEHACELLERFVS